MAQISDKTGIQTVLPETRGTGDDYLHVQAKPEQFGGLIAQGMQEAAAGESREAQGLKELGQGQEAQGRGYTDFGRVWGKIAANDAFNKANDQAQKILYGDPNKKEANGNPDLGYMGLTGQAKLTRRPQVEAELDQLISGARDGLTTLDQQLEYDTISRRYRAQWTGEIGRSADAAGKEYGA